VYTERLPPEPSNDFDIDPSLIGVGPLQAYDLEETDGSPDDGTITVSIGLIRKKPTQPNDGPSTESEDQSSASEESEHTVKIPRFISRRLGMYSVQLRRVFRVVALTPRVWQQTSFSLLSRDIS
jgi:hypothetical protein